MRNWMITLALLTGLVLPEAVLAQGKESYQELLDKTRQAGCVPADHPDFTLMTCAQDKSLWYFTKPNHAAHPGVIRRGVVQVGDSIFIESKGWSYAPAEMQAPFRQWLAQMKALDEQVRQHLQKKK